MAKIPTVGQKSNTAARAKLKKTLLSSVEQSRNAKISKSSVEIDGAPHSDANQKISKVASAIRKGYNNVKKSNVEPVILEVNKSNLGLNLREKDKSHKNLDSIENQANSPLTKSLEADVRSGLGPLFAKVGMNEADKSLLVKEVVALIIHTITGQSSQKGQANAVEVVDFKLPTEAPERYQGLRGPETPPEFIKRVYASWLGKGLDRAHIKALDPALYQAIFNWSRKNEWPTDVDLPTRGEQNRRLLEGDPELVREHLGKFTGRELLREAGRLRASERKM